MRIVKIICFVLLLPISAIAQNGSWWEPPFPFSGDTVSIFFDPTQNSEMPDNVSSLVLHWGVNSWQTPPSYLWPPGTVLHTDGIAARSPMTQVSANLWKIDIPTDVNIFELDYVFNDGTPSNPGTHWAHSTGGADWLIPLSQTQLSAVLLEPPVNLVFGDPLRSPVFASEPDTVHIVAIGVANGTQVASLELLVGGNSVFSTTQDTLRYDFLTADYGPGAFLLDFVAIDTSGFVDTTTFAIVVNAPFTNNDPPPPGVTDGINYIDNNTATLVLFAPYKEFVYVIGDFNDWKVDPNYYMHRYEVNSDSVLWWLTVSGLNAGQEYAFQYLVDGNLRIGDPYTEKVLDPFHDQFIPPNIYPNLKPYPQGKTEKIVSVLQTAQAPFTWVYSDTFQRPPLTDLVIYELHVRDFIANHDYQTLLDTLDYLQNLGVNAIELMPISEFEGNSSWGYNPSFYFAPDKYYGTEEALKMFIDECHHRGMAVIMDIVLNHSFGQSPLVRLYWDEQNGRPAANNPWYNQVSPNPVFSFGFDFNHESPHTQAFVDRVNRYWLTEYRFDGFRFDFTKGFTNTPGDGWPYDPSRIAILERMADQLWSVDSTAYVILEHFTENSEEIELSDYGMMLWGNLNYNYNEATMGYHDNGKSDFSWGYYGVRGWSQPNLVTYMESHDEERLMFKNVTYGNSQGDYDIKDTTTALNRIKMAGAFFFTYPGPKMIWQFEELGYDVSINVPCRVCEKPIRWYYFNRPERRKLYKTFAALMKLRKENAVFRDPQTYVSLWLNDPSGKKRIMMIHPEMDVSIIGNFGVTTQSIDPSFVDVGWWYDYFTGDSLFVTNTHDPITLAPGEFHIYTDVRLEPPEPGIWTGIGESRTNTTIPENYRLLQNYPNPFNPVTTIEFDVPRSSRVKLVIYNILGQQVRVLEDRVFKPGRHTIRWNGRDDGGQAVASGFYFIRMKADNFIQNKRMLLLK